jgi:hypothetical protein
LINTGLAYLGATEEFTFRRLITMKLPQFIVIGAGKCGTTSLQSYLSQHPDIFVCPKKETFFFLDQLSREKSKKWGAVTSFEEYQELFKNVPDNAVVGEISTVYYNNPNSAQLIHQCLPDVKIIAILRDPSDRVFSDYLMHQLITKNYELNFGSIIDKNNYFVKMGFYYSQLIGFLKFFKPENVKIFLYDDFINDNQKFLEEFFTYIGVKNDIKIFIGKRKRENLFPKNKILYSIFIQSNKFNQLVNRLISIMPTSLSKNISQLQQRIQEEITYRPSLSPTDRAKLIEIYQPEIMQLQKLINRDLSKWLEI